MEKKKLIPLGIKFGRKYASITSIIDEWEVTEGWWTDQPICRRYFKVNVNDGKNLIIFKDLSNNLWYKQIFG